ncbi:MAG: DUF6351 family protein, partial [Streptosporangiaceae bacterium]
TGTIDRAVYQTAALFDGQDPSPLRPDTNWNGKLVYTFDVGCNAGFHALECKRRGAAYVLGVDADSRYLAQARFAASVLGLEVEWRHLSVYELGALGQRFDYVFFQGVFYHLRYPLYALDLAVKLTRQRLVFQSMVRGDEPAAPTPSDAGFWDPAPFAQPGFPAMYFIEHRFAGDATNWWIPNRAAVEGMLRSAGLRLLAHPEPETWICAPERDPREGFVLDRELAATL